jgi:PAS domain S-box-containing protein
VSLPQSFDLPLLVPPGVFLLETLSSVGLCIGMSLLVIEEYQKATSALQEIGVRHRQLAESDAALRAEINERKRVEQALKENEDQYRDLLEHSNDLLCTHDLEGRLLSVNPAPARVLGYKVEELLKIPMPDLLAPRFRDSFAAYLTRIRKKGEAFGLMRVLTRSGEERIWEYHNKLYTQAVPSPIVRGIARDVTEKIRAEQNSRQSEATFATAFRSNPCAILISTVAEGRFIDVNSAFERQTGYNRDEVIGLNALQLGLCADATEWENIVRELQSGTGVKNRELQLRTKSNNFLTVSYSAEIIELVGGACVLAVAEDITARKQVEEKLRELSFHLVRAQEEERARIARELHDDVNQRLAMLAMQLGELRTVL